MNKYCLFVLAIFGLLQSCSDSELITPGNEFQMPVESGAFIAELDGEKYDFSDFTSVDSNDLGTSINGENSEGQSISIALISTLEEGSFNQAGGTTIMITLGEEGIFTNLGVTGQILPLTVRITDLDMADKEVTGTFSGDVYNFVTGETLTITNGHFKELKFTLVDGGDGILRAKFGNVTTPLNFNTDAVATETVDGATISGQSDNMENLTITLPAGLELGTFTETNQVMIQVALRTSGNPDDVYSNYNAATGEFLPFTLVITDLTENRVKGTFTGTIKKFVGGTGEEIEITEGEIDVPVN